MALHIKDLNDYITPGIACIKPAPIPFPAAPTSVYFSDSCFGQVAETDSAASYIQYEVTKADDSADLGPASINLNDCLACR